MKIDIQSHFDEDPDLPGPGLTSAGLMSLPGNYEQVLESAVLYAARFRGIEMGEIEVAIVDDRQILAINQRHLDHDWETDVISFSYHRGAGVLQGELIVSWETAIRQSQQTGWPALTELALYVIHGTLHLAGMDDATEDQRAEMRRAEQAVMASLCLEKYQLYDVAPSEARR